MKIEQKDDKVIIGDVELDGHIDQNQTCYDCKFHLVYHEKFDAFFCPSCNSWKESACSDPHCDYCSGRPEKPLPTK